MRKLAVALVISFALPAVASNSEPQTEVSNLHFMPNGAVLFDTSTARADVPACAVGLERRWAIDTNTCSIWGDTESVSYLRLY